MTPLPTTPQQIIAEFKEQQYKPVYFLQGPELYYIDLIIAYITKHVIPEKEKQINLTTFHDKKQTIEQIIHLAQQLPMIGKRKVIIIKEAQKLLDLQKASSKKLLAHYIKQPSKHTVLVFAYKNKTLDANNTLAKTLAESNMLLTCKTLYSNQVPSWISQYVHEKGHTISQDAISQLQIMVGANLQVLANELQKIGLNQPKNTLIKKQTIISHIQSSRAFTPFDLQQALSHKNTEEISHIVQNFVQNHKKHPITQTISYLTTFYSKLLQLHHKPCKDPALVAKHLKIHPYLATNYIHAMKNYTLDQTLQNIHHLQQADLQNKGIKSPPLSEETIFKELITKLITPKPITPHHKFFIEPIIL